MSSPAYTRKGKKEQRERGRKRTSTNGRFCEEQTRKATEPKEEEEEARGRRSRKRRAARGRKSIEDGCTEDRREVTESIA